MDIKREAYDKLLKWKDSNDHTTLEVNGARQVGKTYLINKFADENFKKKIYINLFELSGKQFISCYDTACNWDPGKGERPTSPLKEAFRIYDKDFQDDADTVIIIDEIQENAEIYNRIREFTREFNCSFIVTGSYLGRVYDPEFRYSSGDVTKVTIYTLSFKEFLRAVEPSLFDIYMSSDDCDLPFDSLKQLYDIYCLIGGYPAVVQEYIKTKDTEACRAVLLRIIDTFMNESIRYFKDILDTQVFSDIFLSIARILSREKKGLEEDSISEELQKLVTKDYSSNIGKAVCNRAISWLRFSGVISFCGKITEMDILDFKAGCRCYFMDPGLASYYLTRIGLKASDIAGILNEDYVYINLKKRQDFPEEIAFETPAFGTYKGGEIDFVVQSLKNGHLRFAVEVKAGRNTGNTAQRILNDGKVDKLLYLKGNAQPGIEGNTITLPIYCLEKYSF